MTEELQKYLDPDVLLPLMLPWAMKIFGAVAIFVIGRWLARALVGLFSRLLERAAVDTSLASFLANLTYATLLAMIIIAALDTLGFETTSLIAIFGAAGLAVGLALQGSLSNFAAGVMLLIFRPFRAGDFIDAAGTSGKVEEVRIFNTILTTPDNREITIPNKHILDNSITNYSARDTRRVDMVIGISYDDDIGQAKSIIERVLQDEGRVLAEPSPTIMVLELADSSVNLAVRPWVSTADYWATRGDLMHRIKTELEAAGLSIPYPQRDVHLVGQGGNA